MIRLMYCLAVLVFFVSSKGFAQQSETKKRFLAAKQKVETRKYSEAQSALGRIASGNSTYADYAAFLYAFAAHKTGDYYNGQDMLKRLLNRSPRWEKKDEAYYLLGVLSFEAGNYKAGLQALKSITNSSLRTDIYSLKRRFLPRTELNELKQLYRLYPSDKAVGQCLADKFISTDRLSSDDKVSLEGIRKKYAYDPRPEVKERKEAAKLKDSYNAAVFLPFMTSSSGASNRRMQFTYDMYQGMKMAKDALQKEGVKLNLHLCDTKKSSTEVKFFLEQNGMPGLDLMIGPLYPNAMPPATDFSEEYGIAMVNPVSHNELLLKNEYQFLFASSYSAQAAAAADYAVDSLGADKAYIIYGKKEKDEALAKAYKEKLEARGGEVIVFEKVSPEENLYTSLKKILSNVKAVEPDKGSPKTIEPGSLGLRKAKDTTVHIFAALEDQATAVSLTSILQSAEVDVPIFTVRKWLDFQQVDIKQFEYRKLFLMADYHIDYEKAYIKEFTRNYVEEMSILPSDFAFIGFETVFHFGKILKKYGKEFYRETDKLSYREGRLGIDFLVGEDRSNQAAPLLRLEGGTFRKVNN